MERFTGENQGSNVPAQSEEGASSSAAPVAAVSRRMNVADDEGNLWTIFIPPTVGSSDDELGNYSAYLGSLSVNFVSSSFSAADISAFMERYQIPPLVQIRVPEPVTTDPGRSVFMTQLSSVGCDSPWTTTLRSCL